MAPFLFVQEDQMKARFFIRHGKFWNRFWVYHYESNKGQQDRT